MMRQAPRRHDCAEGATASDRGEIKSQPVRDPAFERFPLDGRFSADKVGLAFVAIYEVTWPKRVHLSHPFAGLEKQQCIVSIIIGPGDKLIRLAIPFRGKGRISAVEEGTYDPRVDVFFEASAACIV